MVLLAVVAMSLAAGCVAGAGGGGEERQKGAISETLSTVFQSADPQAAAKSRGVATSRYGVRVDVQTQGLKAEDRSEFDIDGVHVHHFSAKYERVAVSVGDREALHALASVAVVRRLALEYGAAEHNGDTRGDS
jgi:hypothetical protein